MENGRQKSAPIEAVKNAATGYAVIVLGTICFLLSLAAIATVIRIIIGAGTGA